MPGQGHQIHPETQAKIFNKITSTFIDLKNLFWYVTTIQLKDFTPLILLFTVLI